MVSVLGIGPKVRGFNGRDDEFLRAMQIRRTLSLGEEVNCRPHVVRFYGMLKIPAEYERDIS
jgi:hypothetical protein